MYDKKPKEIWCLDQKQLKCDKKPHYRYKHVLVITLETPEYMYQMNFSKEVLLKLKKRIDQYFNQPELSNWIKEVEK